MHYITKDMKILTVTGLFANVDNGVLETRTVSLPVDNRFQLTPLQIQNRLKQYFIDRKLPLFTVRVHSSKTENVTCRMPDYMFFEASENKLKQNSKIKERKNQNV